MGTTATCWDKFHNFYLGESLFTEKGNVRRHSRLALLKAASTPKDGEARAPVGGERTSSYTAPPVSVLASTAYKMVLRTRTDVWDRIEM
ncbi:hypothetical protein DVH05_009202 [Phytophthora capsici]|nr:hypothetical protein DVH05_009202 [Phytophthora capsici]